MCGRFMCIYPSFYEKLANIGCIRISLLPCARIFITTLSFRGSIFFETPRVSVVVDLRAYHLSIMKRLRLRASEQRWLPPFAEPLARFAHYG